MEKALDYNILVAEEQGILNFDIKKSLKARGFRIIEKTCGEDLGSLIKSRTPDLTITCIKHLTKFMPAKDFHEIWRSIITRSGNTDTIVFNKGMKPIAFYSKPFNTNEIINFINDYITKEQNHENTI